MRALKGRQASRTHFRLASIRLSRNRASGATNKVPPITFPFLHSRRRHIRYGGRVSGGVTAFQLGDEVFGYSSAGGAYAKFITMDFGGLAEKPAKLDFEQTAPLAGIAQTAQQALAIPARQIQLGSATVANKRLCTGTGTGAENLDLRAWSSLPAVRRQCDWAAPMHPGRLPQ